MANPPGAMKDGDDIRPSPVKIRDMYDEGYRHIRQEVLRYWVNLSYLYGEQWVYYNQTRNRIEQVPRNDPQRVRVTVNRLRPETRRIIAKALKRPLRFGVRPSGADDASVRGSRIGEAVLETYIDERDWETIRREHAYATWLGGTGLLCVDWDVSKGDSLSENVMSGDLSVTHLSVAEAVTLPGVRDIEYAPYWIKAQALPPRQVQSHYDLKDLPKADANHMNGPVQRLGSNQNAQHTDLVLVLTYYERPSKKNPKGYVAVVVGEECVSKGDWPFPVKDRLNVFAAKETPAAGRWTGDSIYSDAVPIQTAYNASWSSILEHMKLAGNARLQVPDASMELMDILTDTAGEIVPYNSAAGKAEYLSPPQMPAWWIEQPQRLEAAMDDILGVHDVSRGEAPRNIESGLGIALLTEADETPTAAMAVELARCWGRAGRFALQVLSKRVTHKRTARVRHPNQSDETVKWTGKDLAGEFAAFVPEDTARPQSDAARKAQGFALWDRKVIEDPKALAAYIDYGSEVNFIEATDPDVAKARRENHEISSGEPMPPADFDNHQIHIDEHNRFRKTSRYERSSDKDRENIDKHIQGHENFAAEEMAKQTSRMAHAPGLAAAADAQQTPGSMGGPPLPGVVGDAAAQMDAQASLQQAQEQADAAVEAAGPLPGQEEQQSGGDMGFDASQLPIEELPPEGMNG